MKITKIRIPAGGFDLSKFRLWIDGDTTTWDYSSSSEHHYCAAPVKYRGRYVGWEVYHKLSDHEGILDERYYLSFRIQDLLPALHAEGWKLRDFIK